MAASYHARLADKLIDATCPRRLCPEPLIPGGKCIALNVCEGMIVDGDDELVHIGMVEIPADQRVLFVRRSPPAHHLRRVEPSARGRPASVGGRRNRAPSARDLHK